MLCAVPGSAAIRLERLCKQCGRVRALEDVSFDVREGETFGFLGLNGAGKTTTIRILLDLVRPTSGRALIFGEDCRGRGVEVRRRVGYLPGELGFYGDMTGAATLEFLSALGAQRANPERRRSLLDRLQLSDGDLRRPIRAYSTGMKRKLGLVLTFDTDAPLLILDEPTDGLDPLMQDAVYGLLADAHREGRTVFMSSHVLPEVERVCDRIALLRRGELVLVSPVGDVRRLAARTVRVTFGRDVAAPIDPWPASCEALMIGPREWRLRVRGPLGDVLRRIEGLPVADLNVDEPHLDDALREYYSA